MSRFASIYPVLLRVVNWMGVRRNSLFLLGVPLFSENTWGASDLSSTVTSGFLQGLGFFLVLIFLVVIAAGGIQRLTWLGRNKPCALKIVGGLYLGPKEKLVLVEVGENHLLLGVTGQQITLLHFFAQGSLVFTTSPSAESPFPEHLKQIWQRIKHP